MLRLHEDENSSEEILMKDIIFDVVCVEFDAEGQQLQDQAEKLHSAWVVSLRLVV